MDFLEKTKGLLFHPSKTFDSVKDETLNEAIKYFIILAVVYSALAANLFVIVPDLYGSEMQEIPGINSGLSSIMMGMILFLFFLIFNIFFVFFDGVFTHIFVYLMGGRKGFSQTMKAVSYSMAPQLLFGWIPFLIIITILWTITIDFLGIRQLQDISTPKAILAIFLPTIIAIIFIVILIAVFTLNPNTINSGNF